MSSCLEVCSRCLVLGEYHGCSLDAGSSSSSGARVTTGTGFEWNWCCSSESLSWMCFHLGQFTCKRPERCCWGLHLAHFIGVMISRAMGPARKRRQIDRTTWSSASCAPANERMMGVMEVMFIIIVVAVIGFIVVIIINRTAWLFNFLLRLQVSSDTYWSGCEMSQQSWSLHRWQIQLNPLILGRCLWLDQLPQEINCHSCVYPSINFYYNLVLHQVHWTSAWAPRTQHGPS